MKAVVVPYTKEVIVESVSPVTVPLSYDTITRTEGRDGVKLVLASSLSGMVDRWVEAKRLFNTVPLMGTIDVYIEDGFIIFPVIAQGRFKSLPKELEYLLEWTERTKKYRERENGKWYFRDCPAFRVMAGELFDSLWFFFGDRPSFDPAKESVREFYEEEVQEVPLLALAREKRKPGRDNVVWSPSPLFDFRWSG